MSLFPRTLYENGPSSSSFTPLFRLLDEFDSYNRQEGGGSSAAGGDGASLARGGGGSGFGASSWQPKFDVRETGDVYELHGEFPGMRKEDICIEFPQPQTLVVRGKSERTYSTGPAPTSSLAGRIEDVSSDKSATTTSDSQGTDAVAAQTSTKTTEKIEQPKYWLKERRVGEFSRTFNFPSAVDPDGISAGFKDGILSVSVPKAKKPQPRRIAIN